MTRRRLLALPFTAAFAKFRALAAPVQGKVKITAVKAMQVRDIAGNCLIRIDTDAGVTGYGEAGASGPMARSHIERMKSLGMLVGQDPLSIERHFLDMISLMHPYMAHIPTVSGIDIALWDLAGKILGRPVNVLLGGPFRDAIRLYSHGPGGDLQDRSKLADWAARVKAQPEGFDTFKTGIDSVVGVKAARYTGTLDAAQIRATARGFENLRAVMGTSLDFAVHCHNELDTTSAIQVARAVESHVPAFYEDPLPVSHSEGWAALRAAVRIPILAGEKLELVQGFKPFLDRQSCDIIHPDLAFAGGFTGTKKIADYAMLTRTPVALHNVGSLVLCCASAHFGSAIFNFFRSESALGRPARHVEKMAASQPPRVAKGHLTVPDGPGIGFEPNNEYLRANLVAGEPWWG